jgi:hypothetical protein
LGVKKPRLVAEAVFVRWVNGTRLGVTTVQYEREWNEGDAGLGP